jgi:hypothetical protein
MGKKVGYVFTDLKLEPGAPGKAVSLAELYFKANVGENVSERRHKERRVYESKPGGRLLSFLIEDAGDGGTQTLEGTVTASGLSVVRKRPGQPNQVLTLPASRETIEDADQVRVALLRNEKISGKVLDAQDLQSYDVSTTVGAVEERTVGGVKEKLRTAVTLSQKEKVPVEVRITADGTTVEMRFGEVMHALAEPKNVATRLDQVEVFGLTRVILPKPLSEASRQVPGELKLVMSGLPERFHKSSTRQKFEVLPDGKTRVTLTAKPPSTKKPRPLADPSGGENLKSTLIVEADHPEVRALAQKLVGTEKDAYGAALKVSAWVYRNLEKSYGASADRASDVLRQKKGDCTEHSLLTVALLRSVGIPARRIDGVVYMMNEDKVPALYWHEWVEAYVGEWTQLDPTFGQPVADATHFAVGEEGNAEITLLLGKLQVTDVK